MELIKRVFMPYFDTFMIMFIDDVSVYSRNEADHVQHLRTVL